MYIYIKLNEMKEKIGNMCAKCTNGSCDHYQEWTYTMEVIEKLAYTALGLSIILAIILGVNLVKNIKEQKEWEDTPEHN